MQIISISRGSYSRGLELAECLARKLDYSCMGREELLEEATHRGIPVGKMEMAIVKPHTFEERFALVKDHYQALATQVICQRALEQDIVYHGRTGHLLLHGLSNVLRIRVVADMESRIGSVERRLGLNRARARDYVRQVEEDRKRWVKVFYNMDWDETSLYDVIINTDHLTVENAASALCAMAELPEFKPTPASQKGMENLLLTSRCRLALFDDERTFDLQANVRAINGVVSVTYLPRQSEQARYIPDVLAKIPGVREITSTMAQTTIMWVQETFDPASETLDEVIQIANKWGAAVELVKLVSGEEADGETAGFNGGVYRLEEGLAVRPGADGGIEDDLEEAGPVRDEGQRQTYEKLLAVGRAGGRHVVRGSGKNLLHAMEQGIRYSLVVVGNLFTSKGHATQTRMTNELAGFLTEQMKVPVVQSSELKQQYLFGPKQLASLIAYAAVVAVIYILVFTNQIPILKYSCIEDRGGRILFAVLVFVLIPLVSFTYGTATKLFLKMLKFE